MDMTTALKTISISARATILRGRAAKLWPLRCLGCQAPLELSLPDADSPDKLVGACHSCCEHCGSVHLVDAEGESEIMVVMLPSFAVLHAEIESHRDAP